MFVRQVVTGLASEPGHCDEDINLLILEKLLNFSGPDGIPVVLDADINLDPNWHQEGAALDKLLVCDGVEDFLDVRLHQDLPDSSNGGFAFIRSNYCDLMASLS